MSSKIHLEDLKSVEEDKKLSSVRLIAKLDYIVQDVAVTLTLKMATVCAISSYCGTHFSQVILKSNH